MKKNTTDILDDLFTDNMIAVEDVIPKNIKAIHAYNQENGSNATVINITDSRPIKDAEQISEMVEPLITQFNESNAQTELHIRKEIVIQMYEMGATATDFKKLFIKGGRTKRGMTITGAESKWVDLDPSFAPTLVLAKARNKAFLMRRTHLEEFFASEYAEEPAEQGFRLGIVIPYDRTIAGILCDMLSDTMSLKKVCQKTGIPVSTVQQWRKHIPEFAEAYDDAKRLSAEVRFDEMIDIADGADADSRGGAQKARVQVDTRMKYAKILDRSKYGDNQQIDVKVKVDHTVTMNNARKRVEDMRKSILKQVGDETVEVIPADD